jgi:hypothetical protein
MVYTQILRWQKNHLSTPLPPPIVSAAIFATKSDPELYCSVFSKQEKESFIKLCKEKNHFFGQESALKIEFFNNTGFNITDLLVSEVWNEILEFDSLTEYLETKTFNSKQDIKNLCKKIFSDYLTDPAFLNPKKFMEIYKQKGFMYYEQMKGICKGIDNREKWVEGTANQLWFGTYALKCITDRFNKLMECEQSDELFKKSVIDLKDSFHFSDLQIEMLKYFVCQSKDANCPASLNKALYFWSDKKGTGKTTVAATIVCILNGELSHSDVRKFKSTLPQELGFMDHVAPMICSSRAVLLDEAMPSDTSKTYGILKDRITSDGTKVRFVYKNQIDVDCKCNLVFTSNNPLIHYVQDKTERRFLEYEISQKYKNLTYEQIYNIFLQFIRQCKRTREWQEWYDSMQSDTEVKGIESQNIDDFTSYFQTDSFVKIVELCACQISIGTFYEHVNKFEKGFNKQLVRECITKLFGNPNRPSMWRKSDVVKGLCKLNLENENELIINEVELIINKEDYKLPF